MKSSKLFYSLTTLALSAQFTLAQEAGAAASADQSTMSGGFSPRTMVFMAVMFGILWFFMIRPEQKKQKAKEAMRSEIGKGDKVITIGGICGTIVKEIDNKFVLQMDKNNQITILKAAVDRRDEGEEEKKEDK